MMNNEYNNHMNIQNILELHVVIGYLWNFYHLLVYRDFKIWSFGILIFTNIS